MDYKSKNYGSSSKRRRSYSPEFDSRDRHKSRRTSPSKLEKNDEFSFLDHKRNLNKIISYSNDGNPIVKNLDDFWVFVKKYEATLKKAGKPILERQTDVTEYNDIGIPINFSKHHCINFISKIKFMDVCDERNNKKLNKDTFDIFLNIVSIYLDFKNKEKFDRLKKLRKAQSELPVAKYRNEIVSAVQNQRVVIVAGDTGCGKSTQVPQYLHEAGFQNIACTQPRRIACISLSKRVSYEMLTQFDTKVGYQIRFEKSKTSDTKICFITEGLLLRQMSSDNLPEYDVIILDEIHERHLMGDFLLGVLKCLIHTRTDIKLVLMSATINIKLFQDYFSAESAVVIQVPGRLFSIELNYKPILIEEKPSRHDKLDPQPYVQIMQLIDSKYPKEERGDLLIFMSGVQEITTICDAAQQYAEKTKSWIVLPLHSALSLSEQDKVFDYPPDGVRKCIVSTNIAETSVTIDGIRFVIDSGKVKEMSYDSSTKMQRLKEFWISKASADQRKGRAGRTGPGVCYRVYSEQQFTEMEPYSTPEVSRVPITSLLLLMTSLGVNDVRRFPFIDAPSDAAIEDALLELKQHGALASNEKLTPLGRCISSLPLEVSLAKSLVISATLPPQCQYASLVLAGALGLRGVLTRRGRDLDCENARKPDESDHGDPITLLCLYCSWLREKSSGGGRAWCRRRGIEEQRLYELTKLTAQLRSLLQDNNLLDSPEPETMSSSERAMRHGQLKQLKDLRRQYKQKAAEDAKRRKRLKVDTWEIGDEDDDVIDVRDIEFRMTNDAARIRALISGASTSGGQDLVMLKIVLCRALYPQIAIADEFNYCKTEQLYHTWSKPSVFLHPTSYFGRYPKALQLTETDIQTAPGYKSKLPLSNKHQLLCYLSLLETTKPYIVNSMRMPAAQTLLLLAHSIDTNTGFTRIVCDSWLLLEFPFPESGCQLLYRASTIRKKWDELINRKLADANPNRSVEEELQKSNQMGYEELQHELSCEISKYMNCDVSYTLKRLLPGDLKVLYDGDTQTTVSPNPFDQTYVCRPHDKKGGVYVTDNIVYNCIVDSEWSYDSYQETYSIPWVCPQCEVTVCLSPLERLQHRIFTCSSKTEKKLEKTVTRINRPNTKEFICDVCNTTMFLTPVEILKHKKACKIKEQ
ncbi:probable ATP-dependent RNA helicase DHX34 [Danaus plexippus]|uniref:probable ATP-dependent RNA helicase DHX34 n=1 Tax=Danaus plexippus TaxID=13037 RepID=UPI002AB155A5|nr:probable ATP-dependent RNA helicase DHX34 [Danaus plexippus]XP_061379593.1 probable ATP-dependent RNA helicase DHX34 [Danaus plexippus]